MKKSISFLLIFTFKFSLYAQVSDFESIDFTRADNRARLYQGEPLDNLPVLAYKLTNTLPTQVEKFRAIFFWVCHNIKADHAQHSKPK